jgi:hypothetical protein
MEIICSKTRNCRLEKMYDDGIEFEDQKMQARGICGKRKI